MPDPIVPIPAAQATPTAPAEGKAVSEKFFNNTPEHKAPETNATPPVVDPAKPADPVVTPPVDPAKVEPPKDPATPENKGEVKYDLKLPEGSKLPASAVEQVTSFAKENGLTNEHAQKILERENSLAASVEKSFFDAYDQEKAKWKSDALADKEIGGSTEKLSQNVVDSWKAMRRFGSEAFVKLIEETGYGDHPEVVRTFMKIGQAMAPDRHITPPPSPQLTQKSVADKLYDKEKK